jgi:hypothetical protein
LDLIGAMAAVERDLREAEWRSLERLLRYVEDDRIVAPSDEEAKSELARDFVRLGWGVPAGAA